MVVALLYEMQMPCNCFTLSLSGSDSRSIVVVTPSIASTTIATLSDKVKQLHGVCISYNKATTIWLLPVADNFGYKT